MTDETTWESLGLSEAALELIRKAGYTKPSPVQAQAIPFALEGRDVIGSAQTGTGKTAAFVLPMVEKFVGREGTFGLILAPTREIAQQIQATIEIFGAPRGVRSIVMIGGVDYKYDAAALQTYPQIIVATPGRLCDHLDRGNVWLDYIQIVVLDEADRMLDMGFADQLNRIMEDVPKDRQTLLFSATIPPSLEKLCRKTMVDPEYVNIGKPLSAVGTVEQRAILMDEKNKSGQLMRLLRQEKGSIIVFTRSKDRATRVWRSLHSNGVYDATYIHSDRLQSHREEALAEFKSGKYRILIATDVAGRGIHVDDVAHVINYDLPMEPEDYVHRIGRTGRAGSTGRATSFVTPGDRSLVRQIEKILGKTIPGTEDGGGRRDADGNERGPQPSRSEGGRKIGIRPSGSPSSLSSSEPIRAADRPHAQSLADLDSAQAPEAESSNGASHSGNGAEGSAEGAPKKRRRRRRGGRGRGPGASSGQGGPAREPSS